MVQSGQAAHLEHSQEHERRGGEQQQAPQMLALRDDVAVRHQVQQGRQRDSEGSRHAALQAPLNACLLRHRSLPMAPICALPLPSRAAQLKRRLHGGGQSIVQPCRGPRSNHEMTSPILSDTGCSLAECGVLRP